MVKLVDQSVLRAGLLCALAVTVAWLSGCDTDTDSERPAVSTEPAVRIIALSPHLTELIYTAGAGDALVGVVEHSDYPEAALQLPRVGDAYRLDYEAISALEPDLVLAWGSGTPADVRDRLRKMGLRVMDLDASGLDDIGWQITRIGGLTGTAQVADAAAARYAERLGKLRERNRGADVVDVFYQISAQPLFTISGEHVISEALGVCAGRNVFADIEGLSPAVSLESVIVVAPDVIIAGRAPDDSSATAELRAQWAEWTSVPAVQNGNLYTVDADRMHRSTMRTLDAVEELCGHLDEARRRTAAQ